MSTVGASPLRHSRGSGIRPAGRGPWNCTRNPRLPPYPLTPPPLVRWPTAALTETFPCTWNTPPRSSRTAVGRRGSGRDGAGPVPVPPRGARPAGVASRRGGPTVGGAAHGDDRGTDRHRRRDASPNRSPNVQTTPRGHNPTLETPLLCRDLKFTRQLHKKSTHTCIRPTKHRGFWTEVACGLCSLTVRISRTHDS